MQEMQAPSLYPEETPEEGTATPSRVLAWRLPWIEEPWWAMVHWGHKSQTRLSD